MLVSVYYFLPQPKGNLGVHSPPYGGGVGGEGHFYVFYYLCHYNFCPFCHYGFCSFCHYGFRSFCLSFWLLHHSVCHYNFCSLCHYGFCIILSVILASVPYVITSSVPLLLCLLHTLSIMSSVHSVWFRGSFM